MSREKDAADTKMIFAISLLKFLKTREKLMLLDIAGDEKGFSRLDAEKIGMIIGRRPRTKAWSAAAVLAEADRIAEFMERRNYSRTCYWDRDYPPQLREIYDPPFMLYYRGKLPSWDVPSAAAVGTRRPTGGALRAAYLLGLELGRNGVPVVSGLARGIDRAVHRGAVDADGVTIAVLGCGIDRIYPAEHRGLAERILGAGGAVISEYGPGVPPMRYNFPQRNRIISGLSRSVVLVQSPMKSGALITAEYALEQGRDLFVHAGGTEGPAGKGGRNLAEEGAVVIGSPGELLEEWGFRNSGRRDGGGYPEAFGPVPPAAEDSADTVFAGKRLARELEMELEGTLFNAYGGRYSVSAGEIYGGLGTV